MCSSRKSCRHPLQGFSCEPPDQKSSDNTGDKESRRVVQKASVLNNGNGNQKLSDVMGDTSGYTDPHDGETAPFFHKGHDSETEGGSGQTVDNAEHITKQKSNDKDPDCGHQGGFPEAVPFQDKKYCQIGKSELDSGDSCKYRNQSFYISENNGNGCKQTEICCLLFHIPIPRLSAII